MPQLQAVNYHTREEWKYHPHNPTRGLIHFVCEAIIVVLQSWNEFPLQPSQEKKWEYHLH